MNAYPWPFVSVSFGLLFIWIGASQVILLWLALDVHLWGTIQMAGMVVLLMTLLAERFFFFMKNRRVRQT